MEFLRQEAFHCTRHEIREDLISVFARAYASLPSAISLDRVSKLKKIHVDLIKVRK